MLQGQRFLSQALRMTDRKWHESRRGAGVTSGEVEAQHTHAWWTPQQLQPQHR